MKIKDIVQRGMNYVGRTDVAELIKSEAEINGEAAEAVETMLYCVNAVENELARHYFPVVNTQTITSYNKKFEFTKFEKQPVKILSVTVNGEQKKYELFAAYLSCDAFTITVEYEFSPQKKQLNGECELGEKVTEKMLAAGAVSEYCLINGEMRQAEFWDSVYRQEIERARRQQLKLPVIAPRSWI